MPRLFIILAIGLVFLAGFVLDTAGVIQLFYVCATGGCGVRAVWLWLALGIVLIGLLAVALVRRRAALRAARRKPRPASRRKAGGTAKARTGAKATRTPRRKRPAGA